MQVELTSDLAQRIPVVVGDLEPARLVEDLGECASPSDRLLDAHLDESTVAVETIVEDRGNRLHIEEAWRSPASDCCAVARPAPVLRTIAGPMRDRVQRDVPQRRHVVLIPLQHLGSEATLKERPDPAVPVVEAAHVGLLEELHPDRDVGVPRHDLGM
jgi:hypothetical protein